MHVPNLYKGARHTPARGLCRITRTAHESQMGMLCIYTCIMNTSVLIRDSWHVSRFVGHLFLLSPTGSVLCQSVGLGASAQRASWMDPPHWPRSAPPLGHGMAPLHCHSLALRIAIAPAHLRCIPRLVSYRILGLACRPFALLGRLLGILCQIGW